MTKRAYHPNLVPLGIFILGFEYLISGISAYLKLDPIGQKILFDWSRMVIPEFKRQTTRKKPACCSEVVMTCPILSAVININISLTKFNLANRTSKLSIFQQMFGHKRTFMNLPLTTCFANYFQLR